MQFTKDQVLHPQATQIEKADEELKPLLTDEFIDKLVNLIPDEWLNFDWNHTPEELRKVYADFLKIRRDNSEIFIKEVQNAINNLIRICSYKNSFLSSKRIHNI